MLILHVNHHHHHVITILFLLSSSSVFALRINPLIEFSSRDELVSAAGYGEERISNVFVSGSLSCHPCFRGKLLRPRPISGASVVVSCHSKKTKRNWGKGRTDEYGDFLVDIPSHLHAVSNLENLCLVKVVNLPKNSVCYKRYSRSSSSGKVIKLSSIGNGIRSYTAKPIRVSPHGCTNARSSVRQ